MIIYENFKVKKKVLHTAIKFYEGSALPKEKSIGELIRSAHKIIPVIFPVDNFIMEKCFELLNEYTNVMARDALHAAFCPINSITSIYSYDKDFDVFNGITRVEP